MMNPRSWLIILLLAWVVPHPASATLGEDESSVETVRAAVRGQRSKRAVTQTQSGQSYTVSVITHGSSKLCEFLSGGKVIEVVWDGATTDFKSILGTYFSDLQSATQVRPKGRGPLSVKTSRLEFHQGGHARHLGGRAWDPALLPTGLDPWSLSCN